MSSTTPNLGLTKTTAAETIGQNWAASNDSGGNFDIIDTKMGAVGNTSVQAQLDALNSKIATKAGSVTDIPSGATNNLTVRQSGNVVSVWGYINGLSLSANTQTKIAKIGTVSLPNNAVRTLCMVSSAAYLPGTVAYLIIDTNGEIAVNCPEAASNKSVLFNATYIVT